MNSRPVRTLLPFPPGCRAEPLARKWLAGQCQIAAAELPLMRDERGRPRLATPLQDHDASWSHSGNRLLVACGKNLMVGCDLEYLRPRPNALRLAQRFFHPQEALLLESLPEAELQMRFLQLWCGKEAVLKAHGHGLSFGLEKLRLEYRESALVVAECDPQLGRPEDWQLELFSPADGYIAVIAWREIPDLLR